MNMPLSKELEAYIKKYPLFKSSLKLYNPSRFLALPIISLPLRNQLYPAHEIIGLFYFDKKIKLFKQDYIININNGIKFISYTAIKSNDPKKVKHINEFFNKYGVNEKGERVFFKKTNGEDAHYYRSLNELDQPFRGAAELLLKENSINWT